VRIRPPTLVSVSRYLQPLSDTSSSTLAPIHQEPCGLAGPWRQSAAGYHNIKIRAPPPSNNNGPHVYSSNGGPSSFVNTSSKTFHIRSSQIKRLVVRSAISRLLMLSLPSTLHHICTLSAGYSQEHGFTSATQTQNSTPSHKVTTISHRIASFCITSAGINSHLRPSFEVLVVFC